MFLYLDATAGGLLIQVLLGGFAGIGFVGRLVWSRVSRRPTDHESTSSHEAGDYEADPEERAA